MDKGWKLGPSWEGQGRRLSLVMPMLTATTGDGEDVSRGLIHVKTACEVSCEWRFQPVPIPLAKQKGLQPPEAGFPIEKLCRLPGNTERNTPFSWIGCQVGFAWTWASHGHGCSQLLEWIWFQRLPIWLNVAEYQKHTANLHVELFNDVFTTHSDSSGNAPALGVVLLPDNHLWNFAAYCFHSFPSISYGLAGTSILTGSKHPPVVWSTSIPVCQTTMVKPWSMFSIRC